MEPTTKRFVGVLVVLALVAGAIYVTVNLFTGGFNDRSVKAYCQTWQREGQKIVDKQNGALRRAKSANDPFIAMSAVMGAPRDLADFFDALDKVAPDEIEPAVAQYRDAWKQTADNLGDNATDPLAFLSAQLMVMMTSGGAEQAIDTYTQQHCTASSVN